MTITHHVTITEQENPDLSDGRPIFHAYCTCPWSGWVVFDLDAAARQRDRHLEQAEIDGRTLGDGEQGTCA